MNKNMKHILLISMLIFLLVGISAISASDVSDDTTVSSGGDNKIAPEVTTKPTCNDKNVGMPTKNIKKEKTYNNETNSIPSKTLTKQYTTNNNIKTATSQVNNYNELVNAVNTAKQSNEGSYTINMSSGNYIATSSMSWATQKNINKNTKEKNIKEAPASSWDDIQQQVNNAQADTTITLSNPINCISTITWDKQYVLTIDGQGHAIQGNQHQVFSIGSGASLVLKNMTIRDAYSTTHGGAISNNGGTLIIMNSTLNNNTSERDGGAVYNDKGTLIIIGSNLTNNKAIKRYYCGGAIASTGTLNITDSYFNNNSVERQGGAMYVCGLVTITNSNLTNNNANVAGAIFSYGNLIVTNTTIMHNYATDGGALLNNGGTLNITNSNLTHNYAKERGGAIYNSYANMTLTGNNITDNTAPIGGAIYNTDYSNMTLTDNNITNNSAYNGYGGAIHNNNNGNITLTGNSITNNTATQNGGAINNNHADITLIGNNITNNTAPTGGAIHNYNANITLTGNNITHNTATGSGGAINNNHANITLTDNNITHNTATWGGAINNEDGTLSITYSNLTYNKAERGAVIYNTGEYGTYNITHNTFKNNTATSDKETLNLGPINDMERLIEENIYDNTDINITTINLTTQDQKTTYQYGEDITLNYTIELANPNYYDPDILEKINKTLYIDTIENSTTSEKNYTLSQLAGGEHTVYYKTYYGQSNNLTLIVKGDSEISTDKTAYDHIDGIKNMITLNITDPITEKGTINIRVKDPDGDKNLSTYSNVRNGYQLSTDTLVEALENLYTDIDDAYTINITYTSNNKYTNPSSTEFTLNIIQKRNTTITYEIINNTEGNVQISITVLDSVYKTPVPDAQIIITGAINNETTAGIITDNTLTPGDYTITVNFNGTDDYNKSNTTIDFTVEIDKDKKIEELEGNVTNLTDNLKDAQQEIQNLTNTNNQLKEQLNTVLKTIENLNTTINNLTKQLENAQQEIQNLNQTITELNKTMNTTITIKPVTSSVGSQLNLTATITDETGNNVTTGKVLFKVNGITLKDTNGNVIYAIVNNGEATLTTKTQAAWIKNTTQIQAVYSGEKPYKSSRANTTNINISKGKATITLEEKSITAKAGQTITLKAKVLDSNGDRVNNDKVVFKLNGRTLTDKNGTTLYARVIDGEAVLEYTIPETYNAKTYNLTVVFGGNYYERTQTQGTLLLEKKATTITPENINTNNGTTTIKATIRDETGNTLISTTKAVIKINGKTITNTNSTNGTIDTSFTTTLRPGTYELTIISGENGQYQKATLTTALKI